MLGVNCGLGFPIVVALHLSEDAFSQTMIRIATVLTIGMCTLAGHGAAKFLPEPGVRLHATDASLADLIRTAIHL
jgi:hypothetical protein